MKRLYDGGIIILIVIGLGSWFFSGDHETTSPETECSGAGCENQGGTPNFSSPSKPPEHEK